MAGLERSRRGLKELIAKASMTLDVCHFMYSKGTVLGCQQRKLELNSMTAMGQVQREPTTQVKGGGLMRTPSTVRMS
jgi:hypothetical protein